MHTSVSRGLAVAALLALAGPALARDNDDERLRFVPSSLSCQRYDGASDDLLTAGLGKTGLGNPVAPAIAAPASPTAAELRRLVIWNNYRALADMSTNGGYGVLYGPNIDLQGKDTLGEGKIAGEECLAYADDGTGRRNVTMMVQIPASFDARHPCIVAASVIRLARRVWRDRHHRRMGPQARLRGRLHRQGHRERRARSAERHRESHRWRAHRRERRRQEVELHRAADGRGARGVQRRDARPLRLQARALGPQPGAGLGRARAGVDPLRVRHPQRALRPPEPARQGRAPHDHEAQHDRHRLERLERRRRLARRGRARRRPPDRRRGGVGAAGPAARQPASSPSSAATR